MFYPVDNCQQYFGSDYRIVEIEKMNNHQWPVPEGEGVISAPPASSLRDENQPAGEVERLYLEIFDAVIDQRLRPGVKLTEAVLCDAFACSRGTVRAALAQLQHDKIVELQPNRGAFVAQPDIKETRDVFEARRMVEAAILDKLLSLPDLPDRLQQLWQMVRQERAAFERQDRVSWIRLSNAFHVQLVRLAENEVLTELMNSLCSRTSLIIALYDKPGCSACSFDEHEQILQHLSRGDRQAAQQAMRQHLQDCEQRMHFADRNVPDPWTMFHRQL